MRISANLSRFCVANFRGIAPAYVNQKGQKITPINNDPTAKEVNEVIEATKKPADFVGYNGEVFFWGKDLVIKKYKGPDGYDDTAEVELKMLDKMYENNLQFSNCQKGCYCIEDGKDNYLVSTRVEGAIPDVNTSKFTKSNLQSLVKIITEMDKGGPLKDNAEDNFSNMYRFMNYDFHVGNLNLTPTSAGLFDFEYSEFINIDKTIQNAIHNKGTPTSCHRSDTSELPSSLRSFEYYTLCYYLRDSNESKKIFKDYLNIKSSYHKEMSEFYKDFKKISVFPADVEKLEKSEKAHSNLLKADKNGNIPKDIMIAEARKIQMANFLHECSGHNDIGKINRKQLSEYITETNEYFTENLSNAEKSKDEDRIIYYENAISLMNDWKDVEEMLDREIKNNNEDFVNKITNKTTTTIEKVII